jgi:23S rRNA pseudouridine955/2504/2580 synthase
MSDESRTSLRTEVITEEDAGQRLDKVLSRFLPGVPRTRIFRLLRKGEVRLNGKRASGEVRVSAGDVVRVPPVKLVPSPLPADVVAPVYVPDRIASQVTGAIIHEDERLLVLDKPAGIAVHGGSGISAGVIEALRAARPDETLELVHRLDRDTSGCLMVSRRRSTLRALHAMLREEDSFDKRYLVLVRGKWELGKKLIDAPLRTDIRVGGERTVKVSADGKASASEFQVVEFFGNLATLLEVRLLTGRTHQIRVHAAYAGYPVAGDEKYGDEAYNRQLRDFGLRRLFLHAHSIGFEDPDKHVAVHVSAPLPPELHFVIDKLTTKSGKLKPAGDTQPGVANPRIMAAGSVVAEAPPAPVSQRWLPRRPKAADPNATRPKSPGRNDAASRKAKSTAGPRAPSGRSTRSTRTTSRRGPHT